jgi:hypothetical protein
MIILCPIFLWFINQLRHCFSTPNLPYITLSLYTWHINCKSYCPSNFAPYTYLTLPLPHPLPLLAPLLNPPPSALWGGRRRVLPAWVWVVAWNLQIPLTLPFITLILLYLLPYSVTSTPPPPTLTPAVGFFHGGFTVRLWPSLSSLSPNLHLLPGSVTSTSLPILSPLTLLSPLTVRVASPSL